MGTVSAVTVNPGESIQTAINNLPAEGGIITLTDGIHNINETLYPTSNYTTGTTKIFYSIGINKSNITITGTHNAFVKAYLTNGACFQVLNDGYSDITFQDFSVISNYTTGVSNSSIFQAENISGFTVESINESSGARYLANIVTDQGNPLYSDNTTFKDNVGTSDLLVFFCIDVIIENNAITGGTYALNINRNIENVYVLNNTISGGTHALHIHGAATNLIVRNNTLSGRNPLHQDTAGDIVDVVIENNIFKNGRDYGIRIAASGNIQNYTIKNNQIYNNGWWVTSVDNAPGIFFDYWRNSYPRNVNITNNVIHNNSGDGIQVDEYYFTVNITNNIIVNNSNYGINLSNGTVYSHTYNDIWNNTQGNFSNLTSSTGEIFVNPLFVDISDFDFHIKSTIGRWNGTAWITDIVDSPCIDTGGPSYDYSNEPEPNGNRINMGAYGNTIYASKSTGWSPDSNSTYDGQICTYFTNGSRACTTPIESDNVVFINNIMPVVT